MKPGVLGALSAFAVLGLVLGVSALRSQLSQPTPSPGGTEQASSSADLSVSETTLSPTTIAPSTAAPTSSTAAITSSTSTSTSTTSSTTSTSTSSTSTTTPASTSPPTTQTPEATIPETAIEIARPEAELETSAAVPIRVVDGRVETADGVAVWADPNHPAADAAIDSTGTIWAITSTGALVQGSGDSMSIVNPATGLGYSLMALTDAHVVAATTSGAVVAFPLAAPGSSQVIASPQDAEGRALIVTAMAPSGGEGVRAEAGGFVFLLTASEQGVAVNCGPIGSASC